MDEINETTTTNISNNIGFHSLLKIIHIKIKSTFVIPSMDLLSTEWNMYILNKNPIQREMEYGCSASNRLHMSGIASNIDNYALKYYYARVLNINRIEYFIGTSEIDNEDIPKLF